jgi:predicted Rossmann-fold nucleotide-binding protein
MPRELHSLAEFDSHVAAHGSLNDVVIQGVDLAARTGVLLGISCSGATFLGSNLTAPAMVAVLDQGAVVFPRLPGLPFDPYRPRLYHQGELLEGWEPGGSSRFALDALDSRIRAWASRPHRSDRIPVVDALAQRLHDHAIDDALRDHLESHPDVVAVMGGHGLRRNAAGFRTVAELGRSLTRKGWLVASGGGPGAMEAANLGAWLAPHPDHSLDAALDLLAAADGFEDVDRYLAMGRAVLDVFDHGGESLAVPTWFYGHEPTNQFATHVAKYFANSIREDGLLALATRGVVFAPGAAGTTQEVFQDATQNHYGLFGMVSPMVFLDRRYWRETLPAEPLLRRLAADHPYAALIGTADTAGEVIDFLSSHPPLPAG